MHKTYIYASVYYVAVFFMLNESDYPNVSVFVPAVAFTKFTEFT